MEIKRPAVMSYAEVRDMEREPSMAYHRWILHLYRCLRFGVRMWWGKRPWVEWY